MSVRTIDPPACARTMQRKTKYDDRAAARVSTGDSDLVGHSRDQCETESRPGPVGLRRHAPTVIADRHTQAFIAIDPRLDLIGRDSRLP
jgi:hypothetical protein